MEQQLAHLNDQKDLVVRWHWR